MSQKLNEYQKEAVSHLDGPCLVTSCPGSGKTFTLVERIIKLIEQGVNPKNILCLTFTNKAGNEMKERVCKRLQVDKKDLNFFIGTFHSLCAKLIRELGYVLGYDRSFNILDDKDQFELVSQLARFFEYELDKRTVYQIINKLNTFRDQMENFEWVKTQLTNPDHVEIAEKYLKYCRENSQIDFSGLIYETINILEADESIKDKIQNTFKYILVDETQDTNKSQFHLINLLGGKYKNIMLIGDIDQSIYRFRGANYKNIEDFLSMYPNCRIISLSKNYRSTPQIVSHASKLIKHNTSHMGTKFETDNPVGEPVRVYNFQDQLAEAHWVGTTAKRLIEEGGWEPSDIAILYRINKMSEPLEGTMVKNGIPYEVIGSWNFYDRKEVRDCLAMIKLITNPKDGVSFNRVSQIVSDLGPITVGRIEKYAIEHDCSIIEACKNSVDDARSAKTKKSLQRICDIYDRKWDMSNPAYCVNELVKSFNYRDYIDEKYEDTASDRKENIDQIRDAAGEYNGMSDGLSQYLQQVSLITSTDNEKEENKLVMMSLHAAKGLEFPIVFMVGVEDGILPHALAVSEDEYHGMEEERRLCYVGMTRAKQILYMSWCRNRRKFDKKNKDMAFKRSRPSKFIQEAGLVE